MFTECSINTGGVSDLIFVYEASEHRVLWSSGITGDTGLSVMKVMGRKLVTSSLSQPETHQMRSQNVIICSPVCLHLRVFTMINSGLSPHICVAMVRPWLVSVYLSGIIPVSPHSPDLTLATAQTWPRSVHCSSRLSRAGWKWSCAHIPHWPVVTQTSPMAVKWKYFRQSSSCLSCHLILLAIRGGWLFCCFDSFFVYCFPGLALILITSRHSGPVWRSPAPQLVAALGKITPLVMFVARLPGIWASWQHHTLAGGVGPGTSHKWREQRIL